MSGGRAASVCDEEALAVALEKRILKAEKCLAEAKQKPTKILHVKDLFASDDLNLMRQVSLRATKTVQAYCHVMFDLPDLLGFKEVKNVTRIRFKHTYDSKKQKDCIQEAITSRLAAVWCLGPIPPDLDKDLSAFGCWNIHRGPINKILATLTGVLRNRVGREREYNLPIAQLCGKRQFDFVCPAGGGDAAVEKFNQEETAALAILSLIGGKSRISGEHIGGGEDCLRIKADAYQQSGGVKSEVGHTLSSGTEAACVWSDASFRDKYYELKAEVEMYEQFIVSKQVISDEWVEFHKNFRSSNNEEVVKLKAS